MSKREDKPFREPGAGRIAVVSVLLLIVIAAGIYAFMALIPIFSVLFPKEGASGEEALGVIVGMILSLTLGLIVVAVELIFSFTALLVGRPLRRSVRKGYRVFGWVCFGLSLGGLLLTGVYVGTLGYMMISSAIASAAAA